jgi:hypothetical protein
MAYVDDTNCLLPIEDVHFFLERFKHYGEPLGAIMNTEKTRILTSTNGFSTLQQHIDNNELTGHSLQQAIATYSTKDNSMHEVTDGLRILGSPVGSTTFQLDFINNYLQAARSDAEKLLQTLNDEQTILQLYRACTAQRLTHLFSADVYATEMHSTKYNHNINEAGNWCNWTSALALDFDDMNQHVIKSLTKTDTLPPASNVLMNINTKYGGLGLPSPRCKAVASFMLSTKQTLNSIHNGIITGKHKQRVPLPRAITTLYETTQDYTPPTTSIFNKYATNFAEICHPNAPKDTQLQRFTYHSSHNICQERINAAIAQYTTNSFIDIVDNDSINNIEEILHNRLGIGLLDLDRSNPKNRQSNPLFQFNLKRCLRMNIWPGTGPLICSACKRPCDRKGDHLFQCNHITRKHKTKMHNQWRDTWKHVLGQIDKLLHISDSKPNHEKQGHVEPLKDTNIRPFDVDITVCHHSKHSTLTCPLDVIGFDIVTTNAGTPTSHDLENSAKQQNINTLLQESEKKKFQKGKGKSNSKTNKANQITFTGEDITNYLYNANKQLIPFAISPNGLFGPIINRFLYGTPATKLKINQEEFPAAYRMANRSISNHVPSDILNLADAKWRKFHHNKPYGTTWKCPYPSSFAEQEFGHATCFANGEYGLEAIKEMRPVLLPASMTARQNQQQQETQVCTPTPDDDSETLSGDGQTPLSNDESTSR